MDKSFSVTGKTTGIDISHSIRSGDNFISPAVKTATSISSLLGTWNLALGTHISDVKRFNATTQSWESYAAGQFTQFEPGKGYNILGLQNASFSYGKTETTTTFVYDSTGSRVKKLAPQSPGGGTVTTIYLGKDYEIEGAASTKHIFLGDRRITTKKSTGDIFFIHTDHINSSNVITDSSGSRSALLEYDPYGATVTHTGSANPKHKFTGQESDDSTRLYYYNARYYDSQLGRFITADPTIQHPTDPQDFNRYAYARNNPIRFTDPTGLGWFKKFIAAVVGFVVGAATFIATGDPRLAFKVGVAAYRATDALLNGAKFREAVVAGINGYGEGDAILKNPGKAVGLFTDDPTTDRLTKEGRKVLEGALTKLGLDRFTADKVADQIEGPLTKGNRSFAAINGVNKRENEYVDSTAYGIFSISYELVKFDGSSDFSVGHL